MVSTFFWGQTLSRAGPCYAGPLRSTARLSHMGTSPCRAHLGQQARALPPSLRGVLPGIRPVPALSRPELCGSPLCPGARVGSDARPTLALSAGDNRRQACGPSGRMSVPLRVGQLAVHKGGVTSLRVRALTRRCPPAKRLPVGTASRAPPSSAFPGAEWHGRVERAAPAVAP